MHTSGTTSGSPQVEWRPDPAAYELSRVELTDEAVFRSGVEAAGRQSWLHYFPFLYCFSTASSTPLRWERCGDSVCLYILKSIGEKRRLQLYVPPFPLTQNALAAAEERMTRFNGDRRFRILWVEQSQFEDLEKSGYQLAMRESEYIYSGDLVRRAEGKPFESLRRNLRHVHNLPGLVVREYRSEDREACLKLLAKWRAHLTESRDIQVYGYEYTKACLRNAFSFGPGALEGEIIAIDDQIRGFAFGGPITSRTGSLFIAIADHQFPGLGYLLRTRLMQKLPQLEQFNDSSDTGREGLAYVKSRFRPIAMNKVYQATRSE